MSITTSPIPFVKLPRQDGTWLAETPAAQSPYATAVEANFARVNTWAGSDAWNGQFKVRRESGGAVFLHNEPDWVPNPWVFPPVYPTPYVDGLIQGDLRYLSIAAQWQGFTSLNADAYGGITDQKIGWLLDVDFMPGGGQQICFTGAWTGSNITGTAIFYINPDGSIWLAGLSQKWGGVSTGDVFIIAFPYMTWGA